MISTHTVVQLGQPDARVKHEASIDADGYLGLYRRQSATEADVVITVSFHGRPDRVLAELTAMREVVIDALAAQQATEMEALGLEPAAGF